MDINFLLLAKNKWTFIAFCLNMRKLEKCPNTIIYTPVFLDATCSGIQQLAALIGEAELGVDVNLKSQEDSSIPGDIYTKLLIFINKEVQNLGKANPLYSSLSEINLTREIVKKPIMTKTYNTTVMGKKESITNTVVTIKVGKQKLYGFLDKKGNIVLLTYREVLQIAKVIYGSIYIKYPGLKNIFDYLLSMIKAFNTLNIPMQWVTPAGVKRIQNYNKILQNKISIYLGGKARKLVLQEYRDEMNKSKQSSAGIPNMIHSLDAAHNMILIKTISNVRFFTVITVHDCFGTHPNNISELNYLGLTEFIKLYTTHDFLNKFHHSYINVFKSFDLDIQEVKDKNGKTKTIVFSTDGRFKVIMPENQKLVTWTLMKLKILNFL